jgi:beta-phosphoglucomutase-like phosphatase (HAD superfamily)
MWSPGADIFRHYKPDPETYLGAAALLGCAHGRLGIRPRG